MNRDELKADILREADGADNALDGAVALYLKCKEKDERIADLQKRVLRQERRIKWRNEQIASLKRQMAQIEHRADHYQARCRELAFERLGINVTPDHLSAALDELHGRLQ